ncbi:MAG: cyclic-di-AMP receptor [Armatimonadetes bacterium]|nr:cyclic-di-AMP receptor [Armatimonadota bacterium]
MKLVIAVVQQRDARRLRDELVARDFRFTELGSTGGFLRDGSVTLIVGVADEQVEPLLELMAGCCQQREQVSNMAPPDTQTFVHALGEGMTVTVGGASIFVLNVERMIRV